MMHFRCHTVLLLALFTSRGSFAQATNPTFDVASVKPNKSGSMRTRIMFQPGGRFTADNITLKMLIRLAYNVQNFQITGGPSWIDSDKYNIEAKATGEPEEEMRNMTEEQRKASMDRRRMMIQALLADRFKLTLHKESKDAPIYALVVAKSGVKIKELPPEEKKDDGPKDMDKPDAKHPMRGGMRMGRGELSGQEIKLSFLADALSNEVGRKVIDETGLKGDYTFELKWTPDESHDAGVRGPGGPGDAPPPPDANGPSVFTALQEQLGLKLDSKKGPVDLLVIDQAEKASEN
jgi:uncharacterized protein (TIGR03435 family)